jgi:hypothetical protein
MEINKKIGFVKAGMFMTICVLFVSFVVILANTPQETMIKERRWQQVYVWSPLGAEGNPGAGASGFLEIFFINHSANANTTYTSGNGANNSYTLEDWCNASMPGHVAFATADSFNLDLVSEQAFDIAVKVRFNRAHAYEATQFNDTDCDCQITMTCTGWADGNNEANVSAMTNGAAVVVGNNTAWDFIYILFVWKATDGNGYQLADDATLTISEIYIEAKF